MDRARPKDTPNDRRAGGVGEALAAAVDSLRARGIEQPRLDAELLLSEATGLDRSQLIARPETPIEGAAARRFAEMVRRRLRYEPIAYILGRRGFRHLELRCDRRALIPRPETEFLVEVGLELGDGLEGKRALESAVSKASAHPYVLDIGTGSGAIALAVADERPEWAVVATDTSAEALALARENAEVTGLAARVEFIEGTLPPQPGPAPDIVLANLPYIAEGDWEGLPPDVRDFEPRQALTAGPEGLDAIRVVVAQIVAAYADRLPAIALELGMGQAESVAEILSAAGWAQSDVRRDLAGIERVVFARAVRA